MTIASTLILYIRQMSHFFLSKAEVCHYSTLFHTQKRGFIPPLHFLCYNYLSTLYYTFAD